MNIVRNLLLSSVIFIILSVGFPVQAGERLSRGSFALIDEEEDVLVRFEKVKAKLDKAKESVKQAEEQEEEQPKVKTDVNGKKFGEHGYTENGWTWDNNRKSWWRYANQQPVWPQQNMSQFYSEPSFSNCRTSS